MSSGYNELFVFPVKKKGKKIVLTVSPELYGLLYWTARHEAVSIQTLIKTCMEQLLKGRS